MTKQQNGENAILSVIVPTYNIEKYLRQCLDSIVNQTYKNLEIIIIDDNSSDSTPDIIREYAAQDKRIKAIFHAENKGPGPTRNEGLGLATGDYVTLVDHDDWQDLTKYEKMMARAAEGKADIVFCDADEYDQKTKKLFKQYTVPTLFQSDKTHELDSWDKYCLVLPYFLPPWAKIVKMSLVQEHKIRFSEGGNKSDDVLFHYHAVLMAKTVSFVDEILYFHRFFPESISGQLRNKGVKMLEDRFHTWFDLEKICQQYNIPPKKLLAIFIREFAAYIHLVPVRGEYITKVRELIAQHNLEEKDLTKKYFKYYRRIKRFGLLYKALYFIKLYMKERKRQRSTNRKLKKYLEINLCKVDFRGF